jgi:hypothetical protein
VCASYGYDDEGNGLAFSPDGRFVAMPGSGDDVAVHDLTAADPSLARTFPCVGRPQDLAFLDDTTLVVASQHHVALFDVTGGVTTDGAPLELAVCGVPDASVCAIEVAAADTLFVGSQGAGIERWRFAADRTEPPQREQVQLMRSSQWTGTQTSGDGVVTAITGTMVRTPPLGWLLAVDAEAVLARSVDDEVEWRRTADGSWTKRELERIKKPTARTRRLPETPTSHMFDRTTKGMPAVRSSLTGVHAYGGGPVSLTDSHGTRILNRCAGFENYCHGFSPDGRYYAYVAAGYRALVDTERFLQALARP